MMGEAVTGVAVMAAAVFILGLAGYIAVVAWRRNERLVAIATGGYFSILLLLVVGWLLMATGN